MRQVVLGLVFGGWMLVGGLWTPTAYAGVWDWPILSQGSAVVKCIAEDAGTIITSIVTHLTGIAVETFQTVGQCLIYTTAKVTPLPDVPE